MSSGRPYVRPIDPLWWARPPYLAYTLREVTGVAVGGYALLLLAGLVSLAQGEAAYNGWLDFLRSPFSLALNFLFLIGMIAHVWTWFRIMPKTMPRIVAGDRVVPQARITAIGLAVAAASFLITFGLALWVQP